MASALAAEWNLHVWVQSASECGKEWGVAPGRRWAGWAFGPGCWGAGNQLARREPESPLRAQMNEALQEAGWVLGRCFLQSPVGWMLWAARGAAGGVC